MLCECTIRAEGPGKRWMRNVEAKSTFDAMQQVLRLPEVAVYFADRPFAPLCVHVQPHQAEEVKQAA